jgi:Kef-type K+ transport system membrane component KefB
VDNLCLAVIGIAAGCELHLTDLRRREFCQSVISLTAAITVTTWAFVFPAVIFLGPHIGFLAAEPNSRLLSVASLTATLGIARSPASAIAVLREMDARGPFCNLVMSVTVVKDVAGDSRAAASRPLPASIDACGGSAHPVQRES